MKSFIICGSGPSEDIRKDQNYLTYLHVVFNRIYAEAKNQPALIIPCGGPTSCTPPYEGTEAEKIAEYIEHLMHRDILGGASEQWKIVLENQSLSSLENILFAKKIMDTRGGGEGMLFCEQTRVARNTDAVVCIFGNSVSVVGIDFDISKNRYLPEEIIKKKEQAEQEHIHWALQSEENLAKHHAFFEKKFSKLRKWQSEGMSHVDAVTRWYKESLEVFEEIKKNQASQGDASVV